MAAKPGRTLGGGAGPAKARGDGSPAVPLTVRGMLQWERGARGASIQQADLAGGGFVQELGPDFLLGPATFSCICLDPEDRIVGWNQAIEELTGYSGKEMLGSRFEPITVGSGADGAVPRWRNEAPGAYDLVLRHRDDAGRNMRLLMSTSVVKGEGTRPRGYVLVGHGVSVVVVEPTPSVRAVGPAVGSKERPSAHDVQQLEQKRQALEGATRGVLPEPAESMVGIPDDRSADAAKGHVAPALEGGEIRLETRGRRRWGDLPPLQQAAVQNQEGALAHAQEPGSSLGRNRSANNLLAMRSLDSADMEAAAEKSDMMGRAPCMKSQTMDSAASQAESHSDEEAEPVPFIPLARLTKQMSQSKLIKNITTGQHDLIGGIFSNVNRISGYTNDLANQAITSTKSGLEILQHAPLVNTVLGAGQDVLGAGQGVLSRTVELCSLSTVKELQEFVDSANAPIVVVDAKGKVVEWNTAAQTFLEYAKKEVQGKDFVQTVLPRECQQSVQCVIEKAVKGQATSKIELRINTKAGKLVEVLIDTATRKDSHGRAVGAILLMQDMTEVKVQVEQQIVIAKAWAANDAKSRFLANMSHEMRTPLNVVIGNLELLIETRMTPEQEVFAEQMSTAAISLLRLIDNILDLTRIEAGKLDLVEEVVDIRSVVEQAMDFVAVDAFRKGLEVYTDVDVNLPTAVKGDPVRLHQILVNLLSNAVKFTEKGLVFIVVTAEQEQAGRMKYTFRVHDTGIGISEEGQTMLFKRFSQVDSSTSRQYGGAGLGLAVSKQLSELMDGSIGVTSQLGQGSVFWFSANLHVVHGEQAPLPCLPPLPFKPGAIVVSASADLGELVCNSVKPMGLTVRHVRTVKESRELYTSSRVLILCPDVEAKDDTDIIPRHRSLFASPRSSPRIRCLDAPSDSALSLYDCVVEGLNVLKKRIPLRPFIFCPRTVLSDAALVQGANQLTIVARPASLHELRQAVVDAVQEAQSVYSSLLESDEDPESQSQNAEQVPSDASLLPGDRTKPILILESETTTKMALKVMLGKMNLQNTPTFFTSQIAAMDAVENQQVGACIVSGNAGYGLIQEVLKRNLPHPPIVFLCAAGAHNDPPFVRGATHVLDKPVKAPELKACLDSVYASESPVSGEGTLCPRTPSAPAHAEQTSADDGGASMCEGKRILIVEDHPPNARMLSAMLAKKKYAIDICWDGLEAIEKTAKEDYDCILMDCNMPVMDGWQATQAIRLREKELGHKRTSIIAVTANAMKGDREMCIEAGMDDYLSKPVNKKELYETVHRWTLEVETQESRRGAPRLR